MKQEIDVFKYFNNRPDGKVIDGDCSTRCLGICLNKSYNETLRIQNKYSKEHNVPIDSEKAWDGVLFDVGWKRIYIPFKLRRNEFAILTNGSSHPIATHSDGHVCAVFNGKVLDTWDSQKLMLRYVVCHPSDVKMVKEMLKKANG